MRRRGWAALAAALVATAVPGLFASSPAGAATTTLTPVADTYISEGRPTTNFGADPALRQSSVTNRALLRFDTSSVPTGSSIASVTLDLYAARSAALGGIRVHPAADGWTEEGTTWSTQPAWDATVLGQSGAPVAGHWISISLPASAVTPGTTTNLALDFSASGIVSAIASRESGTKPQLTIGYASGAGPAAPAVTTGAPSGVTATAATVTGTVDPNGSATTCWFDYGPTTAYGAQTAAQPVPAGAGQTSLSAVLANLEPGTTYDYRLDCTNADGTGQGADAVVTTSTPTETDRITKILTIVEENHSYAEMRAQMPYLSALSDKYGYATNYAAIRHPSLPNYLAIVGGSTFGVTTDCTVSSCPVQGAQTVFDEAIAAGRTAKVYAEDMTSDCQTSGSGAGLYAVRHTAWPYFTDPASRANCETFQVPAGSSRTGAFATDVAAGALPTVGMLIPNLCNDAHNCSLATADSWLQHYLAPVFAGPDWQSGHLAIVVTADEDDSSSGNDVLTTVLSPALHSKVVSAPLTHYSLSRLLSQVAGGAPLNNAATAADLAQAFGLTVGP